MTDLYITTAPYIGHLRVIDIDSPELFCNDFKEYLELVRETARLTVGSYDEDELMQVVIKQFKEGNTQVKREFKILEDDVYARVLEGVDGKYYLVHNENLCEEVETLWDVLSLF